MSIIISKVFNANVYVDGTLELIGRAKEVKLPEITAKVIEHSGLGMAGVLELPAGLDKMSMSIKWAGIYADLVKLGANPFTSHKLQIRCNHETYDAAGRTTQLPLIVLVTASWKKAALGTLKPQDALETDDDLSVSYIKITLDKEELVEIDVMNNIWKVGGVDVLEQFRTSLSG
jgi:uncharacterized protein